MAAAARPRAWLVGRLDRLLPDRALARRPRARRGSRSGASSTASLASVPDIDLDFPRDIREKLILAVHDRFGRERSGADRGVLDLPLAQRHPRARQGARSAAARSRPPGAGLRRLARRARGRRARAASEGVRERSHDRASARSRTSAARSPGLPRHLSQHPGGMIVSTGPLADLVPLVPAAMEGRQICQWDKDSCADAGFLKIDLLGLGMLSAVEGCVDLIARARGETIDLSRAPLDDTRHVCRDPGRRHRRRLPDRVARADADAAAHAAREPRGSHGRGRARAAGADPGRRRASLPRAPRGGAERTRATASPTTIRCWPRRSPTRSA